MQANEDVEMQESLEAATVLQSLAISCKARNVSLQRSDAGKHVQDEDWR